MHSGWKLPKLSQSFHELCNRLHKFFGQCNCLGSVQRFVCSSCRNTVVELSSANCNMYLRPMRLLCEACARFSQRVKVGRATPWEWLIDRYYGQVLCINWIVNNKGIPFDMCMYVHMCMYVCMHNAICDLWAAGRLGLCPAAHWNARACGATETGCSTLLAVIVEPVEMKVNWE